MRILALDHVHLTAPRGSEDRLRAFYGGLLGLREIPKPASLRARGGVWFDCGNLQLHIGIEDYPSNERSRRHVALRVDSLAAVREQLNAQAITIEEDTAPIEGVVRFYCRDVVGNRLEFVQVVSAPTSAGGWLTQPELVNDYTAGEGAVERVAVSPDGHWLAAGTIVTNAREGTPRLCLWKFGEATEPEVIIELADSLWELAFAPNGTELAAITADGSLETWRVGEFESEHFAELPEGSAGLAYAEDGSLLAVGSNTGVGLFRPGLDYLIALRPDVGAINALAFDAQDVLAVSGEAARIQLWQIKPVQRSSWELLGHESPVIAMEFQPAAPVLAAVTDEGELVYWNINDAPESPSSLGDDADFNALTFSPDGERLAAGGETGQIWLWDWPTKSVVATLSLNSSARSVVFTPDGQHLVAGGADGRLRVWRVRA